MTRTLHELDIEDYRFVMIEGTPTLMEWSLDGTLKVVTKKDFMSDMWDQWNERKPQMQKAKAENARLAEAWQDWTAKRDYNKIHGWDGTPNPVPVGEFENYEHPNGAFDRLTGDKRNSILEDGSEYKVPGTKVETTKLFVDAARLDKNGMPHDENRIRFSFGREGISLGELGWVRQMSYGETGRRLPSFKTIILEGGVIAWEVAVGNLTDVIESGQERWDVEVKAVSNTTELCTVECRNARGKPCVCICGSKNHGANLGLAPTEVIIGGSLVVTSNYRPVTRFYKKNDPEALRWQETGLEWNSDEDPKSLTEIYLQNGK